MTSSGEHPFDTVTAVTGLRLRDASAPRSLLREAIEGTGCPAAVTLHSTRQPEQTLLPPAPQAASESEVDCEWGFHTGNNWTPNVSTSGGFVVRGNETILDRILVSSTSPPESCSLHRVCRRNNIGNHGSRSVMGTGEGSPPQGPQGVSNTSVVKHLSDRLNGENEKIQTGDMIEIRATSQHRQAMEVLVPRRQPHYRGADTTRRRQEQPQPQQLGDAANVALSSEPSFSQQNLCHFPQGRKSSSLDERMFDLSYRTEGSPSKSTMIRTESPATSTGKRAVLGKHQTTRDGGVVHGGESAAGHLSHSVGQLAKSRPLAGRRCMSTGVFSVCGVATVSSPYAVRQQHERINLTMQQRLINLREASITLQSAMRGRKEGDQEGRPLTSSLRITNEQRNRRRAEHNKAIVEDLCDIVSDLFLAESKLIHPTSRRLMSKEAVQAAVLDFVTSLPMRYALGVESPSEVLVHMRLMEAARTDDTKAAVHIVNAEPDSSSCVGKGMDSVAVGGKDHQSPKKRIRLVTVSCTDANGLLEYMTKLLGTGGSRVLDADVMTSRDNIVLDRFVVEMKGRLRLDKLQQYIEKFLRGCRVAGTVAAAISDGEDNTSEPNVDLSENVEDDRPSVAPAAEPPARPRTPSPPTSNYGPLYFDISASQVTQNLLKRSLEEEIRSAVPLSRVISNVDGLSASVSALTLTRHKTVSCSAEETGTVKVRRYSDIGPLASTTTRNTSADVVRQESSNSSPGSAQVPGVSSSEGRCVSDQRVYGGNARPPLMNRQAVHNFDIGDGEDGGTRGAVCQEQHEHQHQTLRGNTTTGFLEDLPAQPFLHFIPLDELMIIEALGRGRISTVYRAAWRPSLPSTPAREPMEIALKVATIGPDGSGATDIEELEREAEIAAHLSHRNICDLIGVASESDCFCLAYEYCDGGTLSSLLADTSRCYEYLPIALDIASGMAYLHSMNVIHRDLKPSNILLTKENRAKVSDFGMSVANTGQELTAETGTYRWMAPEVIRHETYSSNADVYSFGLVLWQLVTREIPFATKTPVQAAYAVAEGHRPDIPKTVPESLRNIIEACWDEDQYRRPSFTYISMALADYAKMAFDPANVGIQTVRMADELLANVEGNSTVNVDISAPVSRNRPRSLSSPALNVVEDTNIPSRRFFIPQGPGSYNNNVGLEI